MYKFAFINSQGHARIKSRGWRYLVSLFFSSAGFLASSIGWIYLCTFLDNSIANISLLVGEIGIFLLFTGRFVTMTRRYFKRKMN